MSVTPSFNGMAVPDVNLVAADFSTAFVSDGSLYSNVMSQYAVPAGYPPGPNHPTPWPTFRPSAALLQDYNPRDYQGPFPSMAAAYGRQQ